MLAFRTVTYCTENEETPIRDDWIAEVQIGGGYRTKNNARRAFLVALDLGDRNERIRRRQAGDDVDWLPEAKRAIPETWAIPLVPEAPPPEGSES